MESFPTPHKTHLILVVAVVVVAFLGFVLPRITMKQNIRIKMLDPNFDKNLLVVVEVLPFPFLFFLRLCQAGRQTSRMLKTHLDAREHLCMYSTIHVQVHYTLCRKLPDKP